MSSAEPSRPSASRPGRRTIIIAVIIGLAVLGAIGLFVAWLLFFGSEAPAAPTLDDALRVLQPSPAG